MHKTVKVRDIGIPSEIQRCVPAWTGIAQFFESRRDRDCSVFFFSRGECILPHVLRIAFVGRGYHGSSVRGALVRYSTDKGFFSHAIVNTFFS